MEWDRAIAAYDGDRIVGNAGRLQLRAHRAGRVTARRGRDGRRRAADPQATGRPSEHDADAARRRAPARRATRHPVGIRGEHLPAIRLRPGFAEGERPTRPSSQRVSPAARLQRPGPPGDRGRGKGRLPAGLRRGEADPRRILHPHARVLGFGGLPRFRPSGGADAGSRSTSCTTSGARSTGMRGTRSANGTTTPRSSVARPDGGQPSRPPGPVALPGRHRPHGARRVRGTSPSTIRSCWPSSSRASSI